MTQVKSVTKKQMFPKVVEKAAKEMSKEETSKIKAGLKVLDDIKNPGTAESIANEIIENNKPDPEMTKAVAVRDTEIVERDSMLSIVGTVTTSDLKKILETQTEQRQLVKDFINQHLVEGVDYGRIHVVKYCPLEEKQRGSCALEYHFSKRILFKPGQEKIFSLFSITDKLEKDLDAYEMLPDVKGLIAYKCVMYQKGKVIGEGRGAATLSGERSDPNSAIKKAEKRARMDACLSLGFSEYFTQDLDDPDYAAQREMMNSKAAIEAERIDKDEFGLLPRDPDAAIDNQERATLHRLILKAGFDDQKEILELLRVNGIADPLTMTSGQAREMMGKLAHSAFAAPLAKPAAEAEPETPPNDDPGASTAPKTQEPDPEIVVDEQYKEEIVNLANSIGLNSRGNMWLMRKVAGKPFAKWPNLSDEEWRRAYTIVQDILDGNIQVDDQHIAGLIDDKPVDFSEPKSSQTEQVAAVFPGAQEVS